MIITNKTLPRRTFLRGLGATMALPVLDSMFSPLRAVAPTIDEGAGPARLRLHAERHHRVQRQEPAGSSCGRRRPPAPNFAFSPTMKSLEPFRDNINVFSGLAQVTGRALGDGPGDHARATATWLTGVHPYKTGGADFKLGISADQIAAQEFGKQTQLASLELGARTAGRSPATATRATPARTCRCRGVGPTSPLPGEINPRTVFERLFGDGESTEPTARMARLESQKSVLDYVTAQPDAPSGQPRRRRQAEARRISRSGPRHRAAHRSAPKSRTSR